MPTLSPRRGRNSVVDRAADASLPTRRIAQTGNVTTLRFKATSFKPIPNPNGGRESRYHCYITLDESAREPMRQLIEAGLLKANVRDPDLKGPIMRAVADTWFGNPAEFHRVCRGWRAWATTVPD